MSQELVTKAANLRDLVLQLGDSPLKEAAEELSKAITSYKEGGRVPSQPELKVVLGSFPESNGKRNWTALITRVEPWGGLVGNCGGITMARGELWNRVAYEAERAKLLLGLRDTEPHILDYGDDIETPEELDEEIDKEIEKENG